MLANYFPTIAKDSNTDNQEEENNKTSSISHVQSWDEKCGWTKLHLFELVEYDTILYIDADSLVVKDVGHLLHIDDQNGSSDTANNNADEKRRGLLAAAPDVLPPDEKFNAGVMVLRPSKVVFDEMVSCLLPNNSTLNGATTKPCTSYDGGDTGFLNSFYPGWYSEMPSYSRLTCGYNAQPKYLDEAIGDLRIIHCIPEDWDEDEAISIGDLRIIHYSSSPKPRGTKIEAASSDATSDQQSKSKANRDELEAMWQHAYKKSQEYYAQYQSTPRESCDYKSVSARQQQKTASQRRKPTPRSASSSMPASSRSSSSITPKKNAHQLVHKRYKELRKSGMGTKEAITMARSENGLDQNDAMDPSKAVGQMFGLM